MALRIPIEPVAGMLVCSSCGCETVEGTAWVYVNTGKEADGDPADDAAWCPACEAHVRLTMLTGESGRDTDADGRALEPFAYVEEGV